MNLSCEYVFCYAFNILKSPIFNLVCLRCSSQLCFSGLLWNVLTEFGMMWRSSSRKTLLQNLRAVQVDDPVKRSHLSQYHSWWQNTETPARMSSNVKEVALDGHEKIATQCYHEPPARGGRPRKSGHVNLSYNSGS